MNTDTVCPQYSQMAYKSTRICRQSHSKVNPNQSLTQAQHDCISTRLSHNYSMAWGESSQSVTGAWAPVLAPPLRQTLSQLQQMRVQLVILALCSYWGDYARGCMQTPRRIPDTQGMLTSYYTMQLISQGNTPCSTGACKLCSCPQASTVLENLGEASYQASLYFSG